MVDDFAVTTEAIADDCCVVVVQGVVNLFTSAQVLGVLLRAIDAGHARLVIDLCDTTAMDSSGMSALLVARRRIARHGGRIVVACVDEHLIRAFQVARLDELLRFEPTREAALAALSEAARNDPSPSGRTQVSALRPSVALIACANVSWVDLRCGCRSRFRCRFLRRFQAPLSAP